jgi:hypothetical protein
MTVGAIFFLEKNMTEDHMLSILNKSKDVLLVEPPYKSVYVPLGLSKIAKYLLGKKKKVTFARKPIPGNFDLICIGTLFTYQAPIVLKTVNDLKRSIYTRHSNLLIGGVLATLEPDYIRKKTGLDPFVGWSKVLDENGPDYTLDYQIPDLWKDYSTIFTSRGCCNKCEYCAVKTLEPKFWLNPTWKKHINYDLPKIKIGDNNLLATPKKHQHDVLTYLASLKQEVMFDGGLYAKLITDENAKLLSKVNIDKRRGIHTAFDRKEDDGHFQRGVEKMLKAGIDKRKILVYVLINFEETPQEANYRIMECAKYDVFGYAMIYRPLNSLTLEQKQYSNTNPYWSKNLLRAFSDYSQGFGYYKGKTFEKWYNERRADYILTSEDWDKWNYKR